MRSLTDGTSTWYFSDYSEVMTIGSTKVYPLIKSLGTIRQSIDIFKKSWSISDVTITLNNAPYRINTSNEWERPSDVLTGLRNRPATVYLLSGSNVTAFSDCLDYYNGYVFNEPEYNESTLSIRLVDIGAVKACNLPQNLVKDTYSNVPTDFENEKIPLVYGEFTLVGDEDDTHDYSGLGLARGIRTDPSNTAKYVVSDHILHTISAMYLADGAVPDPPQFISPTLTADDSGDGTATITGMAHAYVYPYGYAGVGNEGSSEYVTNDENGYDRDDTTSATIKDNYDGDPGNEKVGEATYYINFPSIAYDHICYQAKLSDIISGGQDPDMGMQKGDSIIANTLQPITDGDSDGIYHNNSFDGLAQEIDAASETPDVLLVSEEHLTAGDGSTNSVTMIKEYWARLRFRYAPSDLNDIYVACKGRKYGSWIDSRSSNYSSGDCIEDPAGIIESILRDELGFTSNDIDLTSFINAENTSVSARINIHSGSSPNRSDQIIQQLCEQATFAFTFTAQGKARLIPLNDNTPTTNKTIPWYHILNGKIKISKEEFIVNYLNVASRWQAEYDLYRDNDVYENATSQAESWGEQKYNAEWPNIAGTSAAHVANHLIRSADGSASDDDGLWANEHEIIEFETPMFYSADLEIGDWIELDDTSIDPHIKLIPRDRAESIGAQNKNKGN